MNIKIITVTLGILSILILGIYFTASNQKTQDTNNLTVTETNNLYFLREEEKLAYDVYQTLGEKWSIQAFQNISNSEERHQSKVVELLDKYGLDDKSKDKKLGEFVNQDLQKIYNDLVKEGEKSLLEALYVGATIEILDIKDLDKMLGETQKQDLRQVFENLKMGSQNHLSAFKKQIEKYEDYNDNNLIKIENNNMQSNKINKENSLMVDVRTPAEFASDNFPGSVNIPLDDIGQNLNIFQNTDKQNIVLVCRSGARAGEAESYLKHAGVSKNIVNLGPWQNLSDLK